MTKRNMQLLNWLKTATDERVEVAGASRSYLRLIAYGHKHPSPAVAAGIERATEGLVTRKELRSDDWPLIWPELVEVTVPMPKDVEDKQGTEE